MLVVGEAGTGKTLCAAQKLISAPSLGLVTSNASRAKLENMIYDVSNIGQLHSIGSDVQTVHTWCRDLMEDAGSSKVHRIRLPKVRKYDIIAFNYLLENSDSYWNGILFVAAYRFASSGSPPQGLNEAQSRQVDF